MPNLYGIACFKNRQLLYYKSPYARNYRYEQEWKLGKFFLDVCNGKKSKQLFVSTLNRIPNSVRWVSSMIVVINAKFARFLAAHANIEGGEKRRRLVGTH